MEKPVTIEVPSRRFGRYLVTRRLGQGGQAEVFYGVSAPESGQRVEVALKLMRQGADEHRFAEEADLMGLLSHPNLVDMVEHGVAFGRPYLALEFLSGGDLHARAQRPLPQALVLTVCIEVLKGLSYVHRAKTKSGTPLNLVHGDVNPANVFFGGAGEVKLGDFGVASSAHLGLGPPEGVAAGKLSYLSPEQTYGQALTPATDVWAVGVMLYELLVGQSPFLREGASREQTFAAIRAPKLSFPASLDKPLQNAIKSALMPDLRARFKTAGELAGPLLTYAMDQGELLSPAQVRALL